MNMTSLKCQTNDKKRIKYNQKNVINCKNLISTIEINSNIDSLITKFYLPI